MPGSPTRRFRLNDPQRTFVVVPDEFEEIKPSSSVRVDLRYGTPRNFVGRDMYGELNVAFLHPIAAAKFRRACDELARVRPDLSFVIFDALRPRSVQWVLWNHVKGTDKQPYVADPVRGSMHNYGLALDLSLIDRGGKEIETGSHFDDFREIAQPKFEDRSLKEGRLTKEQIENRLVLRRSMEHAGFIQLPHEWWHYNAVAKAEAEASFVIID